MDAQVAKAARRIITLQLKAPEDFYARIDRWCADYPSVVKPSRPQAIRWMVNQMLVKHERQGERHATAARRGAKRAKRP